MAPYPAVFPPPPGLGCSCWGSARELAPLVAVAISTAAPKELILGNSTGSVLNNFKSS